MSPVPEEEEERSGRASSGPYFGPDPAAVAVLFRTGMLKLWAPQGHTQRPRALPAL